MKQRDQKLAERDALAKKTPKGLWLEDLEELEKALDERDKLRKQEDKEEKARIAKARSKAGSKDARRSETTEKKGLKRRASDGGQAPTKLRKMKSSG